jgi:hypothetical protein
MNIYIYYGSTYLVLSAIRTKQAVVIRHCSLPVEAEVEAAAC